MDSDAIMSVHTAYGRCGLERAPQKALGCGDPAHVPCDTTHLHGDLLSEASGDKGDYGQGGSAHNRQPSGAVPDTTHGVPLPKCASVDSQKPDGAVLQTTRNVSSPTCALNKLAEDGDQRDAKSLFSFARSVGTETFVAWGTEVSGRTGHVGTPLAKRSFLCLLGIFDFADQVVP